MEKSACTNKKIMQELGLSRMVLLHHLTERNRRITIVIN